MEVEQKISIDKCRAVLGKEGESLSDQQIESVRDALYALGESVLDNLFYSGSVCPV